MKMHKTDKKLQQLYAHALDRIEFLSAVLVDDPAGDDKSTELLVLEAAYAAACFSRAARLTGAGELLALENKSLRHYLDEGLKLMSGSGEDRFKIFLNGYFSGRSIRDAADRLQKKIRKSVENGTLHKLKSDEFFADEILDFFLFFDRYACLTHPKDAPFGFAKKTLKAIKTEVDLLFDQLSPVFNTFTDMLTTYRTNVLIPSEPGYGYWWRVNPLPVEDFIAACERACSAAAAPEKTAFLTLVASLPEKLKKAITLLGLEKKIDYLAAGIGRSAQSFLTDLHLQAPPETDLAPAWGAEKKGGGTGRKQKKSPDAINLLRSRYSDDFKKALVKIERNTTLREGDRKELRAFACVLAGDLETLEKVVKKQPAAKKKR